MNIYLGLKAYEKLGFGDMSTLSTIYAVFVPTYIIGMEYLGLYFFGKTSHHVKKPEQQNVGGGSNAYLINGSTNNLKEGRMARDPQHMPIDSRSESGMMFAFPSQTSLTNMPMHDPRSMTVKSSTSNMTTSGTRRTITRKP